MASSRRRPSRAGRHKLASRPPIKLRPDGRMSGSERHALDGIGPVTSTLAPVPCSPAVVRAVGVGDAPVLVSVQDRWEYGYTDSLWTLECPTTVLGSLRRCKLVRSGMVSMPRDKYGMIVPCQQFGDTVYVALRGKDASIRQLTGMSWWHASRSVLWCRPRARLLSGTGSGEKVVVQRKGPNTLARDRKEADAKRMDGGELPPERTTTNPGARPYAVLGCPVAEGSTLYGTMVWMTGKYGMVCAKEAYRAELRAGCTVGARQAAIQDCAVSLGLARQTLPDTACNVQLVFSTVDAPARKW